MTKTEFIEKYGEEAYQLKLINAKEYYQLHKEKIKEQVHAYRKNNLEKCKETNRKSYHKNKEVNKAKQKEYRETHKAEKRQYNQEYYELNKERLNASCKSYRNTPKGRATCLALDYKNDDIEHNRGEGNITALFILKKIFPKGCYYCGETDFHKLGCDRIDNDKPHTTDNVVCSCWKCNNERRRMSFDEFVKKKKMAS